MVFSSIVIPLILFGNELALFCIYEDDDYTNGKEPTQELRLYDTINGSIRHLCISVHECIFFLFGFWMMNIRIMFALDLEAKEVVAKVRRNKLFGSAILIGYFTVTVSWTIAIILALMFDQWKIGQVFNMIYSLIIVFLTNPFKIFIYIKFWIMFCQYRRYYNQLTTGRSSCFVSTVLLLSIIEAVFWEVHGVLDGIQSCYNYFETPTTDFIFGGLLVGDIFLPNFKLLRVLVHTLQSFLIM